MLHHPHLAWLWRQSQRPHAWGAVLSEQHIVLAFLSAQAHGGVRVAAFEQQQAPGSPGSSEGVDDWIVSRLRALSMGLPRRERCLALALHESRCRQGVYRPVSAQGAQALAAQIQLEAAAALGMAVDDVGFDFVAPSPDAPDQGLVSWAACLRQDLDRWQGHARRSGWRLPVVEPAVQAARRALACLQGDAQHHWGHSPQDWQFDRRPLRQVALADGLAAQGAPQWDALVACGAALGLMA